MLQQTSIDQTGIALFKMDITQEEKIIPLFSLQPCEEAKEISEFIKGKLQQVFITNNLCDYKIENVIRTYKKNHFGAVLEEDMDQLACGIPFTENQEGRFIMSYYV